MWRSIINGRIPIPRKTVMQNGVRYQSSDGSSGKGTKIAAAVIGATVLGAGGAIVYAQKDPNFRKMMKDNLPYSDAIFTYIPDWGSKSEKKIPEQDKYQEALIKKRMEREKERKDEALKSKHEPVAPAPSMPVITPPAKKVEPVQKKIDESEVVKRKPEVDSNALNSALETNLKDNQNVLEGFTKDALLAQEAAVEAVKEHARLFFEALDEKQEDDNIWNEVKLAQETKIGNLTKATEALIDTKAALDRLRSHIHKGKENKSTSNNAALLGAEETVASATRQVKDMEEKLNSAQQEAQSANLYKELIENDKHQLMKEMEALLPPDAKGRKLNEEELNILLGHAHRRMQKIQRQLAKQEATEKLRINLALNDLRNQTKSTVGEHISDELGKQRRIIEEEAKKKEIKLREDFELVMRQQLSRQAAAHSDHLQEALGVREGELERINKLNTQEQLVKQQADHQEQVGHAMSRLKGIQHYLQAREELERASRKAQQLWLACQALRQTVRFGLTGTDSGTTIQSGNATESNLRPLAGQVSAIREAAGDKDPLYQAVLDAIPNEALTRGVYTEEALRRRFSRVEKTCKRLAMLENEDSPSNITLYRYFLSYLRSFLVIDAWSSWVADTQLEAELNGKVAVEPSKWSTGDVLARARACLERRELEQALRYASQLRGEPARAASDWLTEARLSLETRQAADVLMTQAAALTVQAYH